MVEPAGKHSGCMNIIVMVVLRKANSSPSSGATGPPVLPLKHGLSRLNSTHLQMVKSKGASLDLIFSCGHHRTCAVLISDLHKLEQKEGGRSMREITGFQGMFADAEAVWQALEGEARFLFSGPI